MKTAIIAATLAVSVAPALADVFATGPMKGDSNGRVVLTTEACSQKVDTFALGTNKAAVDGMRRFPVKNFKMEAEAVIPSWDSVK